VAGRQAAGEFSSRLLPSCRYPTLTVFFLPGGGYRAAEAGRAMRLPAWFPVRVIDADAQVGQAVVVARETAGDSIARLWPSSLGRGSNTICQRGCFLAAISLLVCAAGTEAAAQRPPYALGVKRGSLCEVHLRDRGKSPDDNVDLSTRCRCHDGRQLRLCPVESCFLCILLWLLTTREPYAS